MDQHSQQGPTSGVTPNLRIPDKRAAEAIDWYRRAFDAEEKLRIPAEDGIRLMHAHIVINSGSVMLHDEFPEYVDKPGGPIEGVTLHLQVDDADRWFERALAAGAEPTMPLSDMFWGDRYGQLRDPFGHSWSIGSSPPGDQG